MTLMEKRLMLLVISAGSLERLLEVMDRSSLVPSMGLGIL